MAFSPLRDKRATPINLTVLRDALQPADYPLRTLSPPRSPRPPLFPLENPLSSSLSPANGYRSFGPFAPSSPAPPSHAALFSKRKDIPPKPRSRSRSSSAAKAVEPPPHSSFVKSKSAHGRAYCLLLPSPFPRSLASLPHSCTNKHSRMPFALFRRSSSSSSASTSSSAPSSPALSFASTSTAPSDWDVLEPVSPNGELPHLFVVERSLKAASRALPSPSSSAASHDEKHHHHHHSHRPHCTLHDTPSSSSSIFVRFLPLFTSTFPFTNLFPISPSLATTPPPFALDTTSSTLPTSPFPLETRGAQAARAARSRSAVKAAEG
jgi:hypothetical protein